MKSVCVSHWHTQDFAITLRGTCTIPLPLPFIPHSFMIMPPFPHPSFLGSMTHVPETGTINRFQKSGASVTQIWWYWFRTATIITLLYSKPETGMHVTEMVIYYWSLAG